MHRCSWSRSRTREGDTQCNANFSILGRSDPRSGGIIVQRFRIAKPTIKQIRTSNDQKDIRSIEPEFTSEWRSTLVLLAIANKVGNRSTTMLFTRNPYGQLEKQFVAESDEESIRHQVTNKLRHFLKAVASQKNIKNSSVKCFFPYVHGFFPFSLYRRSLSPIAIRPSCLGPVKRKFELDDNSTDLQPPAKRTSNLVISNSPR